MGKVLLSNNLAVLKDLDKIFVSNGLKHSYSDDLCIVYYKKYVNAINHYARGRNAISCTGTWIYKNKIGANALSLLYEDYFINKFTIKDIRRNLIGTYACVIKDNNNYYVFVDETHTYALYYFYSEGNFIITNTYLHIALLCKIDINYDTLAVKLAKIGLHSHNTPFNGVYRLLEDELIEIKQQENEISFNVRTIDINNERLDGLSKELLIQKLYDYSIEYFKAFSHISQKKICFLTGGVDSRLRLSYDLKFESKVELGYWIGCDSITNGTQNDINVNKKISGLYGLKTTIFNVSEDFTDCYNSLNLLDCYKYGEYVSIYGHNQKWLDLPFLLHKAGYEEIEIGYDPDILRSEATLEKSYSKPYSIKELINNSCLRSGIFKHIIMLPNIEELIYADIHKVSIKYNECDLSMEDAINIFNYARLDMGMRLTNYFNEYFYCYPLMYLKPLWDIISNIPVNLKIKDHLSLLIIKQNYPSLLRIPIYSHNNSMELNKRNLTLEYKLLRKLMFKVREIIINTKIYDKIYLKYVEKRVFPEKKRNEYVMKKCMEYLTKMKLLHSFPFMINRNIKRKNFDLAALSNCVLNLKVFCILKQELKGN